MTNLSSHSELSQSDREFLAELNRLGPSSIQSLCDELGVTATAVRQRLNRLVAGGQVTRETIPVDRGRPKHHYKVTQSGQSSLGNNYSVLATVLWQQIQQIEDDELRVQLVNRLKSAFVERLGESVDAASPEERLNQLRKVLSDEGFPVELNPADLGRLRENHCPYVELASSDKSICELEQKIFSEILGAPVKLTQCCVDGDHCCEFELHTVEVPEN